jgi:glycosyltransferase involved in cell wall biosynthesis
MPFYSIIVPAYNEEELLPYTLSHIYNAMAAVTSHAGEVIVVDNNSTDRTAAIVREHGATMIFEEHQQIARARNAGAAASRGQYLIFVDADTLISETLLKKTLKFLDSGDYCGGGALISFDRDPGFSVALTLRLWTILSGLLHWAAGSYVYCLKEAFDEIGGFDETYYASEEIHLSIALRKWGVSRAKVIKIIDESVITSARKIEWFSFFRLLTTATMFAIAPSRLRNRDACSLWYKRPRD